VLAHVLVPLLFLKILIARRYKQSHSSLKALGMAILVFHLRLCPFSLSRNLFVRRAQEAWGYGSRPADCYSVAGPTRLGVQKEKTVAGFDTVAHSGDSPQATLIANGENHEEPNKSSLAQIERQTHDIKRLRSEIPKEKQLRAKPGQFLRFSGQSMANDASGATPFPPHRSTETIWRRRRSAWKMDVYLFFSMSVPSRI